MKEEAAGPASEGQSEKVDDEGEEEDGLQRDSVETTPVKGKKAPAKVTLRESKGMAKEEDEEGQDEEEEEQPVEEAPKRPKEETSKHPLLKPQAVEAQHQLYLPVSL